MYLHMFHLPKLLTYELFASNSQFADHSSTSVKQLVITGLTGLSASSVLLLAELVLCHLGFFENWKSMFLACAPFKAVYPAHQMSYGLHLSPPPPDVSCHHRAGAAWRWCQARVGPSPQAYSIWGTHRLGVPSHISSLHLAAADQVWVMATFHYCISE